MSVSSPGMQKYPDPAIEIATYVLMRSSKKVSAPRKAE